MVAGSRRSEIRSRKRTEQEEEEGARRQKGEKYNILREDWWETPGAQKIVPREQSRGLPENKEVEEEQDLLDTTCKKHQRLILYRIEPHIVQQR